MDVPTSPVTADRPRKKPRNSLSGEKVRAVAACRNCREKKVKCSGDNPCKYCKKRNIECVFISAEKKKLYTVSEVEDLQHKIAYYETTRRDTVPPSALDANPVASRDDISLLTPPGPSQITAQRSPRGIATSTALSSSDAFGSEVRTLLNNRSNQSTTQSPSVFSVLNPPQLDRQTLLNLPTFPTEEEAHSLLDTVVLHVGISQQLFDPRTFSDHVSLLFHGADGKASKLLVVEALLIFAIGRLLQAKAEETMEVPNTPLFREAMRQLPSLSELRQHGVTGIEIMGLVALYYQIVDQKDDAYTYISIALRLAIMQGRHRAESARNIRRSEIVHGNRLWWSIYMQERRLAAAGGYPTALPDNVISTEPPSDFAGFSTATAMAINVRVARIMGKVTAVIYTQSNDSEAAFISSVQEILYSLSDIENTMPKEYWIEFRPSGLLVSGQAFKESSKQVARTASSLYLSVYSTVIYTIRPVLLHMAKASLGGAEDESLETTTTQMRLLGICLRAAQKSLTILQNLRERELLAKHAFLDLDTTFSVGFIFVLVEAINPGRGLAANSIDDCRAILGYLVSLGNTAACKRLEEINNMRSLLAWPNETTHETSGTHTVTTNTLNNPGAESATQDITSSDLQGSDITMAAPVALTEDGGTRRASVANHTNQDDEFMRLLNDFESNQYQLLNNNEVSDIVNQEDSLYWMFHNPGFAITGVDSEDWRALELQIL